MLQWQITPASPWFKSTRVHGCRLSSSTWGAEQLPSNREHCPLQAEHSIAAADQSSQMIGQCVSHVRGSPGEGGGARSSLGAGSEPWEVGPQTQASPSPAHAHSLAASWVRGAPSRAHRGVAEAEV